MNHIPEELAAALHAKLDYLDDENSLYNVAIFRFSDTRLHYELHLLPNNGTAQLAIDPTKPIQACPMLEFSFRCTDIVIGKSAYNVQTNEIAIRFYDGEVSQDGQRLTMTWIPDGYWYICANANPKPFLANCGITKR